MKRAIGRTYASEIYKLAMRCAVYDHTFAGGIVAVYHDGLCYVWYQNGFDGVQVYVPRRNWI